MEKKNNGVVIILIGVIIVILAVLCVLFATNTINLNANDSKNDVNNQQIENQDNNEINEEQLEVTDELQNKVNESIKRIWKLNHGPAYCGENMSHTDEDAIFNEYNISTHNVSRDYKSLSELKQDLFKYISSELVTEKLKPTYIEKDNKLYCETYHKGVMVYDENNSEYNITIISNEKLEVNGKAAYTLPGETENFNVKVSLEKNNENNWVITKYEELN